MAEATGPHVHYADQSPTTSTPVAGASSSALHRNDTFMSTATRRNSEGYKDETFDHTKLDEKEQPNLVRGVSTRSKGSYADSKRYTYVDEDYNLYRHPQQESQDSLVHNAADIGRSGNYQDLEYADPYNAERAKPVAEKAGPLARFLGEGRYPIEQRIEDKKRGIGRQKYPFLVWLLTLIMTCTFIYELIVNWKQQGTPVSFHPTVNYMLGPSSAAIIHVGARFPPCMKYVDGVPPTLEMGCMNNTANPATSLCTIEDLCGFGGFHDEDPNQWFRFITAVFLHAGFVHILLNMFAQLTLSAQIEREMGTGGFFFTYMSAGIFGNILGGNFALVGIPSLGASGAIFGTVAVTWVDLFAHWKYQYRPVRKLIFMTIELLIGVAIGFIPYVDNFAHLGGFLMGLLVGTTFYPVISVTRRHKLIMWTFRIIAIPIAIILFVVLTRNFYKSDPYAACSWCRYLSCWPTAANDHCKGTGIVTTSTNSTGI
ncbi:hypothetical protein EDD18DRAFT_1122984 [Armillaria luteobubalina]|uniref:Rhomboid-type serine protease n=1 Tax=Armillaria luteobubalina TaxID=153913 RepID=A0AA39QNR1_9AGAR|nr:hypothetical protein EDD18DRAFT_1122984 [Armillaria luteobubalina]